MNRLALWVVPLILGCAIADLGAVELTVVNAAAVPFTEVKIRKLIAGNDSGTVQTIAPKKGSVLVLLTFDLKAVWDADTDAVMFDEKQFTVDGGKFRAMIDAGGEPVVSDVPYIGAYRPGDWETTKEATTTHFGGLWEVASSAKELVVNVGATKAKVKVQGEARPYEPEAPFEVEVVGAKLRESVTQTIGYENKFEVTIENEGGSILELKLKLTPKIKDREQFDTFWSGLVMNRFYLGFGKGGRALLLGQEDSEKRYTDGSYFPLFPSDPTMPQTVTMFFAVPSNLKTFDVYYLARPIAKGTIGL